MDITTYVQSAFKEIPDLKAYKSPWEAVGQIETIVHDLIKQLPGEEYKISDDVAVHLSARIDPTATIKGPAILGKNCLIGPYTFLRGGVYVGENSIVGFCSEVKTSLIFADSAITHLNYVADTIIGSGVNLEAGVVLLNYFNERSNKKIPVKVGEKVIQTDTEKFGALIGDGCMLGGNAALTPGTILEPRTIVKRLELVEQIPGK
jgi:NDP-sugar pyrophosphorylase family protein